MTSTRSSKNAVLDGLTSDAILGSKLMHPSGQSAYGSPDPDSSLALRFPGVNEKESNKKTSLPDLSPEFPLKHRTDNELRSHIRERPESASGRSSSIAPSGEHYSEPRQIILNSYAPRIACFASADTEQFIISKGFDDGLRELLRPFGERIQGKVVIRDSTGASRGWDDFGIRFMNSSFNDQPNWLQGDDGTQSSSEESQQQMSFNVDETISAIDGLLESYIKPEGKLSEETRRPKVNLDPRLTKSHDHSLAYSLYLRKLLSSVPAVPHETFAHPVACIIAVSSRNPSPIDSLRQLYENNNLTVKERQTWMSSKYLRYYVLIHDEENDDITKSTALFDVMKRHFGLHCHLLRLRGSRCVKTDDDSVQVPRCEWLSVGDELAQIHRGGMHLQSSIILFTSLRSKITWMMLKLVRNTYMNLMHMLSEAFSEKW